MTLSEAEVEGLVEARHSQPHQLLGMHPLGGGRGVVVRAFLQDAERVEAVPVHEPGKPRVRLKRIHEAGLFEGVTSKANRVYAYELEIADSAGNVRRTRDPYSFLPMLGELDLYLFNEGKDRRVYEKLGARLRTVDGVRGASFAVWAPNARRVSVVGPFNRWDGRYHPMRLLGSSGVWELFLPGAGEGTLYKFEILDERGGTTVKTDPYGVYFEVPPKNAAIVWDTDKFAWSDEAWLEARASRDPLRAPMSVYEVHLGSWRKKGLGESFGYRELAGLLVDYVRRMGFTHVEFLPVAEHVYYPSWGYQVTGFYAPTSRYGSPEDFQFLINTLHEAGIGVILDWVPAHFPKDDWCLARFDGTCLYEHEDPRKGEHREWGTLIFNYGRNEVRNFLTANALYWCDRFHADGLRVDAVASMLYLDYSREPGEWVPNKYGGRENLEAIDFLREVNHLAQTEHRGAVMIAEESTAWPLVTRPPYVGGLGFTFKWDMGWMHDTLRCFSLDPVFRKHHFNQLTFGMLYRYHENFILPLSHDEVVHGKGSLRGKMPGDDWQGFANLRTLLAYQWLFPGKQLLFMGGEIGQTREWDENGEVDWGLLKQGPYHAGVQRLVKDLNRLYRAKPALWEADHEPAGFEWIDCNDHEQSVLSFLRRDRQGADTAAVVMNLTPVPRFGYRVGLPFAGPWRELLNTDSTFYGGGGVGNLGRVVAEPSPMHGRPYSAAMTLPPLAVTVFEPETAPGAAAASS